MHRGNFFAQMTITVQVYNSSKKLPYIRNVKTWTSFFADMFFIAYKPEIMISRETRTCSGKERGKGVCPFITHIYTKASCDQRMLVLPRDLNLGYTLFPYFFKNHTLFCPTFISLSFGFISKQESPLLHMSKHSHHRCIHLVLFIR